MHIESIAPFKNYLVRVRHHKKDDCHVDVEAFQIIGETSDDKSLFPIKGATHGMDATEDLDNAQRIVEGMIKWDGCSHLTLFSEDQGYNHFCGKSSAVELGALLGFLYDRAREVMGDKVFDLDLYENA